jgi:hypothetical protein
MGWLEHNPHYDLIASAVSARSKETLDVHLGIYAMGPCRLALEVIHISKDSKCRATSKFPAQ